MKLYCGVCLHDRGCYVRLTELVNRVTSKVTLECPFCGVERYKLHTVTRVRSHNLQFLRLYLQWIFRGL
jgi:hypothetical protein